jgi:hypothetical protein
MKRLNLVLFLLFSLHSFAQTKPFAIVELFTSEGCAACPAAEAVMLKVSNEMEKAGKNVFFLEYHVDYWNNKGWNDPYSKYQFTIRQENYSRVIAEKEMYTPQIIVNGGAGFIGSKEPLLRSSISNALSEPPKVNVKITGDSIANDTLFISYTTSIVNANYVLRVAITEDNLTSTATKGENAGRTFHHNDVVRTLFSVDKPELKGMIAVPLRRVNPGETTKLILFIQHKQTMKIYGACGSKIVSRKS